MLRSKMPTAPGDRRLKMKGSCKVEESLHGDFRWRGDRQAGAIKLSKRARLGSKKLGSDSSRGYHEHEGQSSKQQQQQSL